MEFSKSTRVALVAEELSSRADEGALRFLDQFARFLQTHTDFVALHTRGDAPEGMQARRVEFAKLSVTAEMRDALEKHDPRLIFYVPSASLTLNALWRARRLRAAFPRATVAVIGLQDRRYGAVAKFFLSFLRPDFSIVSSRNQADAFRRRGWPVHLCALGVDLDRFRPLAAAAREKAREALGWQGASVVLHVGHLRRRRGLETLMELARAGEKKVVLVASASMSADPGLADELRASGVELHQEYIADIERFYACADAYLFPVRQAAAAIDFPLSVFEALACGLPVLTTPYQRLPDVLREGPVVRFLQEGAEPGVEIAKLVPHPEQSRAIAEGFGWQRSFEEIIAALQENVR